MAWHRREGRLPSQTFYMAEGRQAEERALSLPRLAASWTGRVPALLSAEGEAPPATSASAASAWFPQAAVERSSASTRSGSVSRRGVALGRPEPIQAATADSLMHYPCVRFGGSAQSGVARALAQAAGAC